MGQRSSDVSPSDVDFTGEAQGSGAAAACTGWWLQPGLVGLKMSAPAITSDLTKSLATIS